MNQQHHGTHYLTFPQRPPESQQQLVHQPRSQHPYQTHPHHYQHQHSFIHPYASNHGHTTQQVLQHSRHQLQQIQQPELPLLLSSSPGQLRKGRWSPSEDDRLRRSIQRHGANKWKQVAKDVMSRSGDQCWKRWNDSLDPHLNHSQWSSAEDAILEQAVLQSGRLWSKIATDSLPGRSGLSCKNRWDHIQRKQRRIHQSQREVLQSHASSRSSILDSSTYSEQRTGMPRSGMLLGSGTNYPSHNRISSLSDIFHRHTPAPTSSIETHHSSVDREEDSRGTKASTAGAHLYRNTPQRPSYPRSLESFAPSSWGGMAGQSNSGSALSPYISHSSSFSTPKHDAKLSAAETHGYLSTSSPYPVQSLSNYVLQSASAPAPAMTARCQSSWTGASTAGAGQSTSLLSVLDSGACTGGMLTYDDDMDTSDYGHQQEENKRDANDDCSEPTSFGTTHSVTASSAPVVPSQWPGRAAYFPASVPRYTHGSSQAAIWTPRSAAMEAPVRSYSVASPFYSRPGFAAQHERTTDDQEPPRTQQSAPATAPEAPAPNYWKGAQDWHQPITREDFSSSSSNANQLTKSLPSHPFAFSTDGLASDETTYSASHAHQHVESRDGLETRGSEERQSSAFGLPTRSSDHEDDSFQEQEHLRMTPKVPKLEDLSHSMFYDDSQFRSQARREQEETGHGQEEEEEEEETSDEEEAQYPDQLQTSYSAPQYSASSFGSPRHRPDVASL